MDTFGGAIRLEDFNFTIKERGFFSAFYDAAPMVIGQKTLFGKMPWMERYPGELRLHRPPRPQPADVRPAATTCSRS